MLKWTDELSLDIPQLDNQHKKMLTHFNKILKMVELGSSIYDIRLAMERLVEIVKAHNNTEERMMERYKYPEFDKHKKEHLIYSNNINVITKALIKYGSKGKLNDKIKAQIEDWYYSHLRDYDQKLGEFLRSKNLK
jgi:hemerythrin